MIIDTEHNMKINKKILHIGLLLILIASLILIIQLISFNDRIPEIPVVDDII